MTAYTYIPCFAKVCWDWLAGWLIGLHYLSTLGRGDNLPHKTNGKAST